MDSKSEQSEQNTVVLVHVSHNTAEPALEPGSIILERYKVIGLLGRGGMGSVYHVQHLVLKSEFALKVLDQQSSESAWLRFENEARAANRLDHPNLIKVHDGGLLPDGQPFFVMDLVAGDTLANLLKKKGRLPLQHVLNIAIQVGFALAYAHENGVIHRDLKPSNIMLVENVAGSLNCTVKVVDLGIAKLTGIDEFNQQTLTKTGEIFGSPLYMSPEQCLGVAVDRRTDLYSLGCVLYEALTGAPPLMGDNALSTMMKHQSEKPLSLKEASLGISFPQSVELLVAKLLQKDPADRYSNAQLLTSTLVNIQQDLQEKSTSSGFPATASEVRQLVTPKESGLLSMRNIVSALIILAAYGSGYLTGNLTKQPEQTNTKEDKAKVERRKEIEDVHGPSGGLPDGTGIFDQRTIATGDPYMNTGKEFFSRPVDAHTTRYVFPERSIGTISVFQPNGDAGLYREARGTFDMPAGPIAFQSHKALYQAPRLMEKFRKDELGLLSLRQQLPNDSTPLLAKLSEQTKLVDINLCATACSDQQFQPIKKMPNLKRLYLANCGTSSKEIASLPTLRQLTHLDVAQVVQPSCILQKLKGSKNIGYLRIKQAELTLNDVKIIDGLPNLVDLDISTNKVITDDVLPILFSLKKLRKLNVEYCPITPACAEKIRKTNLKELLVDGNTFNEKALEKFQKDLPGVTVAAYLGDKDRIPDLFSGDPLR